MKVAFISTYPPEHCGIGEYTFYLTEEMAKHIPLLVFSSKGSEAKEGRITSVPCFEVRKVDFEGILGAVSRYAPLDVVHIQHEYGIFGDGKDFLWFLEELKNCTKAICITLHTPVHSLNPRAGYQRELVERVEGVFVHSALAEYELWQQGLDLRKVYLVPHGTHINKLKSSKEDLSRILGDGFSADGSFLITVPGFLRWDKGITNLKAMCKRILEQFPNTKVLVAGSFQAEGDELRELKVATREVTDLFGEVWFSNGFLPRRKLLQVLSASDAILLAYQEWPGHIGVSGMLHLAMGSLKPILASRVPRLVEYTERVPELCFVQEDFDGLLEAVEHLRDNYEEVSRDVKRQLLPLVQKTSWEVTARRHLKIYERLLRS